MTFDQAARLAASLSDMLMNAESLGRPGRGLLVLEEIESSRYRTMLEMAVDLFQERAEQGRKEERPSFTFPRAGQRPVPAGKGRNTNGK